MGEFIDVAAVLASVDRVRDALSALHSEAECHTAQADRTLVFYEEATGDFDRIQALSRELGTAVFACHIHDGDLWLYEFYLAGRLTDKFNTLPSYWQQLTPEQETEWKGDADVLAEHWPNLTADSVRRYLRNQEDYLDLSAGKAYADDVYGYADCWQLTDFLRKLGTPYPISPDAF